MSPHIRASLVALLLLIGFAASAQYPDKAVRWIVPYPPGGGTDAVARVVTDAMQRNLKQPIVIENRPGAATNIAVDALMRSKPDGYTVMQAEAALIYNEHLFHKLPYKPDTDFSYIGAIGRLPLALVVGAEVPVTTLADFITYLKGHPAEVYYGVPGIGTPHHLAMELFKQQANVAMTSVPYQGGAPALQDLIGGRITAMMLDLATGQQLIRAGKVRAIAVTSAQRAPALPQVPTFAELGLKEVKAYAFQGLVGPAGMPADAIVALNTAMIQATRAPKVAAFFADVGLEPLAATPAEFKAQTRADSARWGRLIRSLDLQLD